MNLVDPVVQVFKEFAGSAVPIIIEKRWGRELVYINGEGFDSARMSNYCLKALYINPYSETSMHLHVRRHKTILVVQGKLLLEYNDGKGGSGQKELLPGNAFVIPPGFQHRLCAQEQEVLVIEASTPDDPLDSIRVAL